MIKTIIEWGHMDMVSEFLTAEEIADFLRLPLSTVYKLVQDKRLPGFKVGKHWRFRKDAIHEWIKRQELINEPPTEIL